MSNHLRIFTVLNKKFAMSLEDAELIFPSLQNAISTEQTVELSFDGIENCSSIFLNNLLGKLYLSFGDRVDSYVHYTGIDVNDEILPNKLERLRKRALNPAVYQPIFNNAIGHA